jgi:hypothetical protein
MTLPLPREIAMLPRLTVKQLRLRSAEVFGEPTNAHNRAWLVKRIAWRLQANAEGGLSERALARAAELANDADLRLSPPKGADVSALDAAPAVIPLRADKRLPPTGTILTRPYKGTTIQVLVLADGFEYAGRTYRSLSAVAKAVTGSHCNGYLFFNDALNHGGNA